MATTKPTTAAKAVKKPRAVKKPVEPKAPTETQAHTTEKSPVKHEHSGRYIFATGRRKTSIANVRLFTGKGESMVNKKPVDKYFSYSFYLDEVGQPFALTGLEGQYYFTSNVTGGGPHSQAGAVRHGIAIALSQLNDEVRKVLKKNGLLTRDDRQKERKKPGLKRARRSPQWAKR